jgi:CRISPR-associated protein Cst2
MSEGGAVWEVGLLARVGLHLHSLNNEGTVGTSLRPRRLVVPTGDGEEERDGVSGEMLKHTHAAYVHYLAAAGIRRLPLCPACSFLHPERVAHGGQNASDPFEAVRGCAICDLHGFLVPGSAVSRDSTVQFGWAVSLERARPQSHQHARHDPLRGRGRQAGESATQMPYQRPTRAGTYALPALLQLWRVGVVYEDDKGVQALPPEERRERALASAEALRAMLLRPEGALTTTRLPHLMGLEGAVVISYGPPVPMPSPLDGRYRDILRALAKDGVEVLPFDDGEELAGRLEEVEEAVERGLGEPKLPSDAARTGASPARRRSSR